MNINSIKTQLENKYYIGFCILPIEDGFILYLKDSNKDKFQIKFYITDNVRFFAEVSIEDYGAKFLNLINHSREEKRENFINIMNTNKIGKIEIFINRNRCDINSFLHDSRDWNDFVVKFNELPYNNDENEVIRVLSLLIAMMLSLCDYTIKGFEEGNREEIHCNKYERNPINRQICLAYKGYKCQICGFDFEKVYGKVGKETIEIHHIVPVSKMGDGYIVKPIDDLVPICSNCHTIIHKRKIAYTIDEVRQMIIKSKASNTNKKTIN